MKRTQVDWTGRTTCSLLQARSFFALAILLLLVEAVTASAQNQPVSNQIQTLTEMLARTQSQLEESQRQLNELRQQLVALQKQVASQKTDAQHASGTEAQPAASGTAYSSSLSSSVEEVRERQAVEESQIATHEQSKVESSSRYPLRVTGLLLFNGFVNTAQTNAPATPSIALAGSGSTGATVRQTILGFDAQGPHILGASSFADLRIDFSGDAQSNSGANGFAGAYTSSAALLRLRTAHATLRWPQSTLFFSLDKPLIAPTSPTSLVAVAEPALAWSGNLWTWNPQFGVTHDFRAGNADHIRTEAALVDVPDAPLTPALSSAANGAASIPAAEQSRWPGIEGRIAYVHLPESEQESHLGFGGYVSPHHFGPGPNFGGASFNSWAATIDGNLHLQHGLSVQASVYRGLALGGLGAGAYKDIAYHESTTDLYYYVRPLDDVGGWAQIKQRFTTRFEANAAFGMDSVFAHELRRYFDPNGTIYQNLNTTRTATGNFIWSPNASLLFSLEYRRLISTPVAGSSAAANILGLAAGYKF